MEQQVKEEYRETQEVERREYECGCDCLFSCLFFCHPHLVPAVVGRVRGDDLRATIYPRGMRLTPGALEDLLSLCE